MTLDSVLQDAAPSPPAQPQTEPVAAAPVTVETTQQTPAAEPSAPTGTQTPEPVVPLPAHIALRNEAKEKQRNLESEIDELKRQLVQYQPAPQQPAQQQPQPKQFEWNEDAVLKDIGGAFRTVEQRVEERLVEERYRTSVLYAKQMHPDYDEVMKGWNEVIQSNPYIAVQVHQSYAPGLSAYEATKNYVKSKQAVDPSNLEAEIERRVQERLGQQQVQNSAANVPKSITSARGSGAATPPSNAWSGPPSLEEILAPRNRAR